MNKQLFEKVKGLSKDTGLSDKYLKAITETVGGSIADDCTDEAEIEKTANLIASVAKESQAEATRWASKKNKDPKDPEPKDPQDPEPKDPKDPKDPNSELEKRLEALEKQLADEKAKNAKGERAKVVAEAMKKHNIPEYLRDRLAKSISDEEDVEAAVSAMKQDFITNGLVPKDPEGAKTASAKQVEEAAEDLLKSITV